jgi:DNA-binding SARP family transcriptional activator
MVSGEPLVRICLLGKPALFIEGRLQPFGGPRKAIALLAYVLLHRDRALLRAAVAEQFWPDEEDEGARASLRRHLHRALSALPDAQPHLPWILADKVTLRWNPQAALGLDTAEYERLCAAGDREAAVALYRGDYLEDFYEDWVVFERERLRERHFSNLIALVDERRRALDYPAAIAFAQELLRLDPLREDAIRRLMSLRFAAGDRSGALADFETFNRRLRDELSADPMPETMALLEAIRSNDLSTLERGKVEGAREGRPGFPFVGRAAALHELGVVWESAARGSATTAIVSGEAGAGKSRLIGELMALAETQGGRVLFGTTATIETEPYQPIAEALRGALPLLRLDRFDPVKLAALASLVPSMRDLVPNLAPLPKLDPASDRQRLFDAIQAAFEQLSEKRPLLVVLEDLHWAGAATVELLSFIVRRLRGKSVLVLSSFREQEVEGSNLLGEFVRRLAPANASHMALGPLQPADVRTLVAAVAADRSDAMADELYAASDGNALFVTELLRERLKGAPEATLPAGIAGTVTARVIGLSSAARALVEAAAVAGAGFDVDVVRQACGWSFAEVFDALDELLDRAIVRVSPLRRGDFAFSHQLVHAAVYGAVDESARRMLHRRVAKTLEGLFPDNPAQNATVARHYDAAGFPEEAVARYLQAVRYALDVFAQADATLLATRGLELCTNPRDRFELHRLREEAAARAGDGTNRRSDCTAMDEIARNLGDDDLLGSALARTFALCIQVAERAAAESAVTELRSLGERAGSARWVVEAAVAQARLEIDRSNNRAAETVLAGVAPIAETLSDDALAVEYWCQHAFNASWTNLPLARTCVARAGQRVGANRVLRARVLRMEAQIADVAADALELRRVGGELLGVCREIGDLEGQATAHRNLASAAWYAADAVANREHTDCALALFERVEKPNAIASLYYHRGNTAIRAGDLAAAEEDLLRARTIWESLRTPANTILATVGLACAATLGGDSARGRELALEALGLAREHTLEREEIGALGELGSAERGLRMFEAAREHLETALAWRRDRDPRQVLESLIDLIPVYLALGDAQRAVAAAAEFLHELDGDYTRVSFPAQGVANAARAYEAAGDFERARALNAEAKRLLREDAARIEDEGGRARYLALPVHREILAGDAIP